MSTVFPHIFEYCKLVNSLNENDKRKIINQRKIRRRRKEIKNIKIDYSKVQILSNTTTSIFDQFYYQSQNIQFLLCLEEKFQKLRESNYNPLKFYNVKLETLIKESARSANIECYQKPAEWPIRQNYPYEKYENDRNWMAVDIILCIEFAKNLPFFNVLSLNDQKILLKSITSLNAILTAAYYSILLSADAIIYPDGEMPIKHVKFQKAPYFRMFEQIIEPFKRITMKQEEYLLLKAMIFCSTKSSDISDEGKKIINNEFEKYSKLLLNHLQTNFGAAAGAVRYSQILLIMEALIYYAQKGREFYAYFGLIYGTSPIKTPAILDEMFLC